jgi:ribonuclease-3
LSSRAALEQRIGHRFTNPRLLEQALTHRSHGVDHNERLEFLGDGVLGCAVADELYARFPQLAEGKLTRLRASLVREEALAEAAARIELGGQLRVGRIELQPSLLADAVEALIGAVFLDGGYEAARKAVAAVLGAQLDALDPEQSAKDAKTELQERLQARRLKLPEYRVVSVQGEPHKQSFEVECHVTALDLRATGSGTSRQRAEQQAAQRLLDALGTGAA